MATTTLKQRIMDLSSNIIHNLKDSFNKKINLPEIIYIVNERGRYEYCVKRNGVYVPGMFDVTWLGKNSGDKLYGIILNGNIYYYSRTERDILERIPISQENIPSYLVI